MSTKRSQFGKRGQARTAPAERPARQMAQVVSSDALTFERGTDVYLPSSADTAQFAAELGISAAATIQHFLGLFFSFNGRIGRLGFWAIGTFNTIMVTAIMVASFGTLDFDLGNKADAARLLASIDLVTPSLLSLPFAVSNISLQVRRFHDRDVSGTWLLAWFIPLLGIFFTLAQGFANSFFAGTRGANRFDTAESQAHVFD